MPMRTFAKVFKAGYDLQGVLKRLGIAADGLAENDPDQRSTNRTSGGRREFRKAATQYRGARKRMDQLMTPSVVPRTGRIVPSRPFGG